MTIKIKRQGQTPKPVTIKCAVHGNAYLFFDDIIIGGKPAQLAAKLREIADKIEPKNLAGVQASVQAQAWPALPEALSNPETGWPWLLKNYPAIFDGIDIRREPYAQYLKQTPQSRSCDVCGQIVTSVTAKYCSNACKQRAYRNRRAS